MGDIIKINENSWRIEDGGVRYFLLCGTERAALIDSGMNAPDARSVAESLTDLPVIMVNTHADRDHVSGNAAFDEAFMSPAEEENFRRAGGTGTIVPLEDGDVLDLGDRPLRIIDIPGHTPGSIAILDEKARFLISGDSVQDGNIYMFGPMRDLSIYPGSMRRLIEIGGLYDEIWPSHGSFPVSPDLIPKLIEGAEKILAGDVEGVPIEVHGTTVCLYSFPYAGFFRPMPQ